MRRQITVANPAERQVLARYPLTPVAGAVRLAAFYGLYTPRAGLAEGVATPRIVAPAVEPASPTPETVTYAGRGAGGKGAPK